MNRLYLYGGVAGLDYLQDGVWFEERQVEPQFSQLYKLSCFSIPRGGEQ